MHIKIVFCFARAVRSYTAGAICVVSVLSVFPMTFKTKKCSLMSKIFDSERLSLFGFSARLFFLRRPTWRGAHPFRKRVADAATPPPEPARCVPEQKRRCGAQPHRLVLAGLKALSGKLGARCRGPFENEAALPEGPQCGVVRGRRAPRCLARLLRGTLPSRTSHEKDPQQKTNLALVAVALGL